ncbi:MAG: hypothetical protein P8L16_01480 [Ilumatobacter sp.]|nr:hypothetical protein [Ilumatobacter sp.]
MTEVGGGTHRRSLATRNGRSLILVVSVAGLITSISALCVEDWSFDE